MKTIQISHDEHQTIADQLMSLGVVKSRQAANATQCYALMWQHGADLRKSLKSTQFYEHKARLKRSASISVNNSMSAVCAQH